MSNNKDAKETLEKEKLKLEIVELRRHWLVRNPVYLSILFNFLVVGFTGLWTFKSGILDVRKENLELDKKALVLDIKEFHAKKDSIAMQYNRAIDSLNLLKKILKTKEIELAKNYKKLEVQNIDRLKTKDEIINYYKSKLDSLTTLIIKNSAINKGLTDGKGNYITTSDGQIIMAD